MVLSSFIADHRIFQSDWMRDITGHSQPKKVASGAILP